MCTGGGKVCRYGTGRKRYGGWGGAREGDVGLGVGAGVRVGV